jgi:hypothetical protein
MKFERLIAAFCEILPVTDVAEQFSLNKKAVYRIDRKWMALRAAQREEHPVRYLNVVGYLTSTRSSTHAFKE